MMLNIKVLLQFFDISFIKKNLLVLLLFALGPFGEILLLFYLGEFLGRYLVLALAASTGLLGFFVAFGMMRRQIKDIRQKIREGNYPGKEFLGFAGSFVGSICLITPGFVTDILGLFFFMPVFRDAVGYQVVRKLEIQTKELYEYLKLYEM